MSSFSLDQILQPEKGYRYSIDSLLLARFAKFRPSDKVCDLGAGVGILSILAAKWGAVQEIQAVEVQPELFSFLQANVQCFHLEKTIHVTELNWKDLPRVFKPASFDVVISNPPYRKKETGKIPPHPMKWIAKHEVLGEMSDLLKIASFLLKKKGRLYLIYPPLRLEELIWQLIIYQLKIQRIAFVHPYYNRKASHFMVEIVRSVKGEIEIEPTIVVYKDSNNYQPEIEQLICRQV